jgi:hypothetical protein
MGEFIKDNLPDPVAYFEAEGLKLTGRSTWRTTECHFHGGSDSMRINARTGGWVCMACGVHGGDVLAHHMQAHDLDFIGAAKALGAWQDNGQPDKPHKPKPLPAGEALRLVGFESTLVAIAALNLSNNVHLTDIDRARLLTAHQRITTITEAFA